MITPTPQNWQPTKNELLQMLNDAINQLGNVLKAIALHPEFEAIMSATPADRPSADTPPADKDERFCINCGTTVALDGWTLCYPCAEDIASESYEIGEPIMFSQEAKQIMALYDNEDEDDIENNLSLTTKETLQLWAEHEDINYYAEDDDRIDTVDE